MEKNLSDYYQIHISYLIILLIRYRVKFLTVSGYDSFVLKPQAEEGADAPFDVMDGKVVLMADVGKVEHHRQP